MNFYFLKKLIFWLQSGLQPATSQTIRLPEEFKGSIAVLYNTENNSADIFASDVVDLDSQFYIASVSKHMTAFMMLRTLQKLHPDEDLNCLMKMNLNKLFPNSKLLHSLDDSEWAAKTNLLQVFRHKSGLHSPNFLDAQDEEIPAEISCAVDSIKIINDALPKEYYPYEYSNVNYLLLGRLLEELHNDTFDNIFDKLIKVPAGMHSSHALTEGTYPELQSKYPNLVENLEKDTPANVYNFVGAACVISTMRDLLNWVDYFFATEDEDIRQILDLFLDQDSALSKKLAEYEKKMSDNPELLDSELIYPQIGYTIGLNKIKISYKPITKEEFIQENYFLHHGLLDSYRNQFCYIPEKKLAFIILTNTEQEFEALHDNYFPFYHDNHNNADCYDDPRNSLYSIDPDEMSLIVQITGGDFLGPEGAPMCNLLHHCANASM